MAQQLYFSRDSKMHIEIGSVVWEVPVLEGFSFSQATNVTEIGINEMESTAGVSRRGRRAFNDSLSAAEFSFSTYVRPFISKGSSAPNTTGALEADSSTTTCHAVEEALWALFGGPADRTGFKFDDQFTSTGAATHINLTHSNVSTLGPDAGANIYFRLGTGSGALTYKLSAVVLNEATINFDIDGIAQIDWSGMASTITSEGVSFPSATIDEATSATTNFIRNRLTTLAIQIGTAAKPTITNAGVGYTSVPTVTFSAPGGSGGTTATGFAVLSGGTTGTLTDIVMTNAGKGYLTADAPTVAIGVAGASTVATATTAVNTDQNPTLDGTLELEQDYQLTLTGGSITLANNVTYTTPEELGIVNVAVGHVTGSRAVSGSFTCYLADDTTNTKASKDFFDDMAALTTVTSNKFDLRFSIGGAAGLPRLEIHCPQAHVDIPTHAVEDLISIETTFNALPSTLDVADDADLTYVGKAY